MGLLNHISLFSGIGGLDLAAEWAGFETVAQVEFADYPTKVLEKNFPNVERWKDVRNFTGKSFRERTGIENVTVISGGFPCQPHSLAGKRKASADERDLWPDYRRIIGEIKPRWVVAENVLGLLSSENGRFFRGILRDLSEMGYNVGWCTYPASDVGAVHQRERVFTIAHTNGKYGKTSRNETTVGNKQIKTFYQEISKLFFINHGNNNIEFRAEDKSLLCGNDDGISNIVDRLKCLGNAVVPQQAYPIFKAIAEIESEN